LIDQRARGYEGEQQVSEEQGAGYQLRAVEHCVAGEAEDGEQGGEDPFYWELEEFDETGYGQAQEYGEELRPQRDAAVAHQGKAELNIQNWSLEKAREAEGGHCGTRRFKFTFIFK
jgi:hypothetical protein